MPFGVQVWGKDGFEAAVHFVTELGLGRQIYFQGAFLTHLLVELIKKPGLVLEGAALPYLITPPEIPACDGKSLEKGRLLAGGGGDNPRTPWGVARPVEWPPGCCSD